MPCLFLQNEILCWIKYRNGFKLHTLQKCNVLGIFNKTLTNLLTTWCFRINGYQSTIKNPEKNYSMKILQRFIVLSVTETVNKLGQNWATQGKVWFTLSSFDNR